MTAPVVNADCPKHPGVVVVSQQVDTHTWEAVCPVCQHQDYVALKVRVAALWERLGMPVDDYIKGSILRAP